MDIEIAARAIVGADMLLVGTGAGFSADSGLGLYRDAQKVEAYLKRNLTYPDLCQPAWNFDDPETFYGFWGKSMNDYRAAIPHTGYTIIKKWKDQFYSSSSPFYSTFMDKLQTNSKKKYKYIPENLPGPFYIYTSNVDALHAKAGFAHEEINEIHGGIENWQCSKRCVDDVWDAPKDFVFKVDEETMLAHKEELKEGQILDHSLNNGFVSNHPRCPFCGNHSRPSILMFGDWSWTKKPGCVWSNWKDTITDLLLENGNLRLTILEIGAGTNVPSVRYMSENLANQFPKQAHLIRINPDELDTIRPIKPGSYSPLKGGAKSILEEIDKEVQRIISEGDDLKLKARSITLSNYKKDILQTDQEASLQTAGLEEKLKEMAI